MLVPSEEEKNHEIVAPPESPSGRKLSGRGKFLLAAVHIIFSLHVVLPFIDAKN